MSTGSYRYGPTGAPQSVGSSFLTGGQQAFGYGLGAASAQFLGSELSKKGVNFRGKYERNVAEHKLKYDPKFIAANTRAGILAKVRAAKEAGLHPLAALGIAPGAGTGSPSPAPIIPGQSELGGAVEKGINTALNVKRANMQSRLAMEEQALRNDWLRQQMRHSEIKLAAQLANQRRTSPSGRSDAMPGPGPQEKGEVHLNKFTAIPTGETTSAQDIQDRYAEIPEQAMGLVNLGYDTAGYLIDPNSIDNLVDSEIRARERYRHKKASFANRGYINVRPPVKRPNYPTYRRKTYGKGRYYKNR